MSNKVLSAVFDHSKSKNATRLVMLALADRANDAGHCWPSIADLMRRTRLSRGGLYEATQEAKKLNELEVDLHAGPNLCNQYRITLPTRSESEPVQNQDRPVQNLDITRSESEHKPSLTQRTHICSSKDERARDCDFEKFWSAYPRKVAKQSALKAWKKSKGMIPDIEELLAILETHKASTAWTKDCGQFIPHPATWLNQERWKDDVQTQSSKPQRGVKL